MGSCPPLGLWTLDWSTLCPSFPRKPLLAIAFSSSFPLGARPGCPSSRGYLLPPRFPPPPSDFSSKNCRGPAPVKAPGRGSPTHHVLRCPRAFLPLPSKPFSPVDGRFVLGRAKYQGSDRGAYTWAASPRSRTHRNNTTTPRTSRATPPAKATLCLGRLRHARSVKIQHAFRLQALSESVVRVVFVLCVHGMHFRRATNRPRGRRLDKMCLLRRHLHFLSFERSYSWRIASKKPRPSPLRMKQAASPGGASR